MSKKDSEKLQTVAVQLREVIESGTATCSCGRRREIRWFYRCLYCGEWFCHICAETHFGQTIKEYKKKKDAKKH